MRSSAIKPAKPAPPSPGSDDALLDQAEILDQLATGADLPAVLDCLARQLEHRTAATGMRCTILLLDDTGKRVHNGASPSMPRAYVDAIEGLPIGPLAGSCGTAAFRGERVIVEDIQTDPLWAPYRDLAAQHGLRACWSEPIFGHHRKVLGTLAMYYGEPRRPRADELRLIETAARLTAITMHRWRDQRELRDGRERLRLALSASGLGMWDWDLRTGQLHVDKRYIRIFGGDPKTFVPHIDSVQALLHPDDLRRSTQVVADHIRGHTAAYYVRTRFRTPEGQWRWVATFGQVTERDALGRAVRLSGTNQDIDEQVRAEEERQRLGAHVQLLMDSTDEGICGLDEAGRCTFVNRAATHLLGYAATELLGRDFVGEVVQDNPLVAAAVRHGERLASRDQKLKRRDGTLLTASCSVSPMLQDGRRAGAVLMFSDVSEARELSQRLQRQALEDPLTGLANRRSFEERLRELVQDARATGNAHALCYLDLDQFKLINDSCGHAAGDRLLQQLASVLRPELRERDLLARLGGDEFGVLLVNTPLAQAVNAAEGLRDRLQHFTFQWGGRKFAIGASIGVVPVTPDSGDVTAVLVAADAACYVAKEGGRNRVHISLPDDKHVLRHRDEIRWVGRIREALEEDRFQLVVEPLVDLRMPPGRVRHFEVLTRMRDGAGGLIMPGSFIPAAERYQLMPQVDLHILRSLLRFLAAQPPEAVRPECASFAVNLSGSSLGSPGLLEAVLAEIRGAPVAAACLTFEITETAAIANLDESVRWMKSLKDLGCRFSLDDFGSGLSSYAYLKSLPVDYLKIDGGFIRRADQDTLSRAIVDSINDIGHQMGLRTIAEHVETDAVLTLLRDMGVDFAQGHAVGRGQPLAELPRLLQGV
jgi:diguanylate cyclase (GGDEF)-like protein/PAS domain S-box-containing protein